MNILKVLGVVVGIHLVAYLVIAQPGCRSTATKPAPVATASSPMASEPTPVTPVQPEGVNEPILSLNLPVGQPPAGDRYAPTRPGAAQPAPTPAQTYTVKKGDSFYLIAHKNGTTVAELTAANNLTKNSVLRPGQKLVIPGKGGASSAPSAAGAAPAESGLGGVTYTVKSGDTLSKIASRYHTTSAALRSANGISGDHLRIGQELQIPVGGSNRPAPMASLPPAPAAMPVQSALSSVSAAPAGVHTVSSGDTAESIARKYQISVGELVRANNITDPRKIRIGQVLTIPGRGAAKAARPSPSLVPEQAPVAPAESPEPTPAPAVQMDEAPLAQPVDSDAPVVPVDDAPPAVPVPQID